MKHKAVKTADELKRKSFQLPEKANKDFITKPVANDATALKMPIIGKTIFFLTTMSSATFQNMIVKEKLTQTNEKIK